MSTDRISARLAIAVETLDGIAAWLDPQDAGDVRGVATTLHILRLTIEREALAAARVPA